MDKDKDLEIKERDAWLKEKREAEVFAIKQHLYQCGDDLLQVIGVHFTDPVEIDSVLNWHFLRLLARMEDLLLYAKSPRIAEYFSRMEPPKLPPASLLSSKYRQKIHEGDLAKILLPLKTFVDKLRSKGYTLKVPQVRDKDEPFILYLESIYQKKKGASRVDAQIAETLPENQIASSSVGNKKLTDDVEKIKVEVEGLRAAETSRQSGTLPDIVAGPLSYKGGSIYFDGQLVEMRSQLNMLCYLFMCNHKKVVEYYSIIEQIVTADKRKSRKKKNISKYVSELHILLKKRFRRKVIFNHNKEGYILDTNKDS